MNEAVALGIARETLIVAVMIGAPVLIVTLVIGVSISIVQAVTQVNEVTLTFVPKVIGVAVVLLLLGPWMLNTIVTFTTQMLAGMGTIGQ
jgi:flagellar biosynthesis protein FliQ